MTGEDTYGSIFYDRISLPYFSFFYKYISLLRDWGSHSDKNNLWNKFCCHRLLYHVYFWWSKEKKFIYWLYTRAPLCSWVDHFFWYIGLCDQNSMNITYHNTSLWNPWIMLILSNYFFKNPTKIYMKNLYLKRTYSTDDRMIPYVSWARTLPEFLSLSSSKYSEYREPLGPSYDDIFWMDTAPWEDRKKSVDTLIFRAYTAYRIQYFLAPLHYAH